MCIESARRHGSREWCCILERVLTRVSSVRRHRKILPSAAAREALHLALDTLDLFPAASALGLRDRGLEVLEEDEVFLRGDGVEEFFCRPSHVSLAFHSPPWAESGVTHG